VITNYTTRDISRIVFKYTLQCWCTGANFKVTGKSLTPKVINCEHNDKTRPHHFKYCLSNNFKKWCPLYNYSTMTPEFLKYSYGFKVSGVKGTLHNMYILLFLLGLYIFRFSREDNTQKLICVPFLFVCWRNFRTAHKIKNGNQTRSQDIKSFLAHNKLYSGCFIKLLTKPIKQFK